MGTIEEDINELRSHDYWLFIEDVGDEIYSSRLEDHQALVPKWLGELHTSASRLRKPHLFPDLDTCCRKFLVL